MEIEHQPNDQNLPSDTAFTATTSATDPYKPVLSKRNVLLLFNILLFIIGGCGGPLIIRVYFLHGGNRKWFPSFLQTAAFPFLLIPIIFSNIGSRWPYFINLSPFLLVSSSAIGLITGVNNFLFTYGISYLPVSTSSLLFTTQLAFTAFFAFFIVKQKFTAASINAIVVLTSGAVVLGVHSNGDRPEGESNLKYFIGFITTLAAAVLFGVTLPLVELMYAKSKREISYSTVLEIQFVISVVATAFCLIGMVINHDFQAISREMRQFGLGETKYYLVVIFTAIICQFYFLGMIGTINYSSAFLGGVIGSVCIPITEVLAVFFFHEKFDGLKGVALALSLWGMASYFYGEYITYQRSKAVAIEGADQLPPSVSIAVLDKAK